MAGYVLIGMLAAFGLVCAVWILCGLFFRGGKTGSLVFLGEDAHICAQRYIWLREMGLVRDRLLIPDNGLEEQERQWLEAQGIEICDRVELAERFGIGAEVN